MGVHIDEPGKTRKPGQVNCLDALRKRGHGSDAGDDTFLIEHDHLVGKQLAGPRVEQLAALDRTGCGKQRRGNHKQRKKQAKKAAHDTPRDDRRVIPRPE
jgi:hypothetical protein